MPSISRFSFAVAVLCFAVLLQMTIAEEATTRVFVTGAAGFIGSHMILNLKTDPGTTVLGIDNFDLYYSVALKRARAKNVRDATGVEIIDGDICNDKILQEIFKNNDFTHIVNLAAQPGVRYSFVNPMAYIRNNLQCFTTLLEAMRTQYGGKTGRPMPRLLYASSSSVYGINKKVPFSESDEVLQPSNLYGATKRANELIAHSYHHLFGITTIGFRFFTVYGPWGRPDMAAYIFTKNILANKTITMYNDGDNLRDFTYIDDIVSGLVSSVRRKEDDKWIVYNLGNSKPVSTKYFLELLEKSLHRKASMRFEVSKAEMPVTYANSTLAKVNLGFVAKTSIEEGLSKYMDWFRQHESSKMPCESGCSKHDDFCFKSGWGSTAAISSKVTDGCKVVTYTVSTSYDTNVLHPAPNETMTKCNVAYVSNKCKLWLTESTAMNFDATSASPVYPLYKNWTLLPVPDLQGFANPRKGTRVPKIDPRKFCASSVSHAIYIDSSNILTYPPEWYLGLTKGPSGETAGMVAVQHARSDDVFDEYTKISYYQKKRPNITYDADMLEKQIKAYDYYMERNPGIKFNNLFDGSFLIHDLKSTDADKFRCNWFEEYMEWGDRDQVAGSATVSKMSRDAVGDNKASESVAEWLPVYSSASGASTYVRIIPKSFHPMTRRSSDRALFLMQRLKYSW